MVGQHERRIHESTSRLLCRLAFVFFGGLPVVFCLGLSCLKPMPFYHAWRVKHWNSQLSELLSFDVQASRVDELAPGRFVLHQVELRHPESKGFFAKATRIDVDRFRKQWIVRIREPVVDGSMLAASWQVFHDAFLCLPRVDSIETHVHFDALKIQAVSGVHELQNLSLKFATRHEASYFWVDFDPQVVDEESAQLPADEDPQVEPQPVRISVVRIHRKGEQATHLRLATQQSPLPCSLIQLFWPSVSVLGEAAQLLGGLDLEIQQTGQQWRAVVGGRQEPSSAESDPGLVFLDVDFESLCWNAPADLTGKGWLKIDRAVVTNRRVEFLRGAAEIGSGRVNTHMLQRANRRLGVALAPELLGPATPDTAFLGAYFAFWVDAATGTLDLESVFQGSGGTIAMRNRTSGRVPLEQLISVLERNGFGVEPNAIPNSRLSRLALRWLSLDGQIIDAGKRTAALNDPTH